MFSNRLTRWLVILVPTLVAILFIVPPKDRLKGGIDLVGGTSLLFEIDTAGMTTEQRHGLSEKVMGILKSRVDPSSQMNLVWRPIGNNKIEIQMPKPSADAQARREAYEKARDAIRARNVSRIELESALNRPDAAAQAAELERLKRDVPVRTALFEKLLEANTAYVAANAGSDPVATDSARKAYEAVVEAVMASNVSLSHVTDVVALPDKKARAGELEKIKAGAPAYAAQVDALVKAYDVWSSSKGALEDASDLKRRIRGAGVLEFRILADRDPGSPTMIGHSRAELHEPIQKYVDQLQTRGPRYRIGDRYLWLPVKNVVDFMNLDAIEQFETVGRGRAEIVEKYAGNYYVLVHADREFGLLRPSESSVKWRLAGAYADRDPQTGKPCVAFQLDPRGGNAFGTLTENNIQRQLSIVLDGVCTSHATIKSQIHEHGTISGGDFTYDSVSELVNTLEAGSLPARLKETPLSEKEIGPSLGKSNRDHGLQAAIVAFIAVAVFMIIYYRLNGVVADLALVLNLLFTLALMSMLEATFTLPGIAGLILTIGMAVDANVLIFERMREERDRGVPLRKAIKLGYDRAFSSIFDSNLTTLLTCLILYAVGSEEIKGFAMTLGFGLATSMFTALFVTRQIFDLLVQYGLLKSLSMMRLMSKPNIDWMGKRRAFLGLSTAVCGLGVALFTYKALTDKQDLFGIDFLGGTSVLVELKPEVSMTDEQVREAITANKAADASPTAVTFLQSAAADLEQAAVSAGTTANQFIVNAERLTGNQVAVLIRAVAEDQLTRGGATATRDLATFDLKPESGLDLDKFKQIVARAADYARKASTRLESAGVQTVAELGEDKKAHSAFEIVTVETNKELVQTAVVAALGDRLSIERAIDFRPRTDSDHPEGLFPIDEGDKDLGSVIGGNYTYDVSRFKGGVALVFDELSEPLARGQIDARLKNARLQPEFQGFEWRDYDIFGLTPAGTKSPSGEEQYGAVAIVAVDENLPYYDDPNNLWVDKVAKPELAQAKMAFGQEKSLRKVIQFAPQIAAQAQTQAFIAMVLAWIAIVAYLWFRFGTIQWGLAAIVALVHDVIVSVLLLIIANGLFGGYQIDLTVTAALLTIIGFSVNDTIVIFDRVRENRGKLGSLSANLINASLNQTLSRTILTTLTAFATVFIMFFWGGDGAKAFSFAMMGGMISGTYSTVGIALPLLHNPVLLNRIITVLAALGLFGGVAMATDSVIVLVLAGVLIFVGAAVLIVRFGRGQVRESTSGAAYPAATA